MLTHIPNKSGYHKDRIKVVKLSIESMFNNTKKSQLKHRIFIWDNGSCVEWRSSLNVLLNEGKINQIMFSPNIGKCEAIKRAFFIIDTPYVMYSDDDVLFYPNCLDKEFELLENIPNVVLVGGSPIKSMFNTFLNQIKWLQTQS